MARNIEIKARITSVDALALKAAKLADSEPIYLSQDDTFFKCDTGRLKLRTFSEHAGELIFYQRAIQAGPKESFYVISRTSEPATLREALTLAHGQDGSVIKKRTLFLMGQTRIHLDVVERLGHFLELEVVLSEGESSEFGVQIAHDLMTQLGVTRGQLVEAAYVDLLADLKAS